jgi:hypothetical protein
MPTYAYCPLRITLRMEHVVIIILYLRTPSYVLIILSGFLLVAWAYENNPRMFSF